MIDGIMKKNVCLWLFFIIDIFVFRDACAQTPDSILIDITGKLSEYTSKFPREEIYIHSDKEEYIAGEDMWLKVFLIDRQSNRLSDRSRIVYFELLNVDGQPVIKKRFIIANGTGPGHLILPDTMSTGFYTVRAYTNWMKNFLPFNSFMKEIVVYNTLKQERSDLTVRKRICLAASQGKQENTDINLNVNNGRSDSLEIFLERKDTDRNGNGHYIIIQARGNIGYSDKVVHDKNFSYKLIPKSILPEGINQIVIFDSRGIPVAEKLIYIPVEKNEILRIESEISYGLRDKISIGFQPVDTSIRLSEMSISVPPLTESRKIPDIQNYLVFASEYNSEACFISENILNDLSTKETDSILSGASSNWIKWSEILTGRIPEIKYPHEDNFHFLQGTVTDGNVDTILMFSPGKDHSFQYTLTDSTGHFNFKLHIDEEEKDLILMLHGDNGIKKIMLTSSFNDMYPDSGNVNYLSEEWAPSRFSRSGIDFQVRKLFKTTTSDVSTKSLNTPLKPTGFYGIPDMEINLSEFVDLPTMGEVFLELIPDVALRKRRTGYEVIISQRINDRRFVMNPAIMIDGIAIKEASLIAELYPGLVEKIDIINKKYLVGGYLFDGIVNVMTKTADFSCIPLPDYMIRTKYRIAEPVPEFHSPGYSSDELRTKRSPDYRNVIYWNPSVSTENQIEFWSSDNKANYFINVIGITGDGRAFSEIKMISVE